MATQLAGAMYEMVLHRRHQHGATCLGVDCFKYTFLAVCALSLLATLLAVVLWHRTRNMYATIIKVHPKSTITSVSRPSITSRLRRKSHHASLV